jgi:hypothetical protein
VQKWRDGIWQEKSGTGDQQEENVGPEGNSVTEKLKGSLGHLNSVHQNIQFTMVTEREDHLPFLDIDIYMRPDGCLAQKVHCKPTHTNPCLNSGSTTAHPTSKLYSPPCGTGPGPGPEVCVTVINWSF